MIKDECFAPSPWIDPCQPGAYPTKNIHTRLNKQKKRIHFANIFTALRQDLGDSL